MSITEDLTILLKDFDKAAKADAGKKPDASPWALLHLSGMRKMLRAYNVARELWVIEKMHNASKTQTEMTINEKNKLEAQYIEQFETTISEWL